MRIRRLTRTRRLVAARPLIATRRRIASRALAAGALACLMALPPLAAAGDDATPSGWSRTLNVGLSFTQNTFSNWEAGGTSSVAWAWAVEAALDRQSAGYDWQNSLGLEYGLVKQQGEDLRKSVDRIEYETIYTHLLDYFVEPFAAASARTQFALGRDYKVGDDVDTSAPGFEYPETSRFADPLYLTQSLGVGRQIDPYVKSRFGVSLQETITENFRRYGCTDEERTAIKDVGERDRRCDPVRVDSGLESVTEYARVFEKRTNVKSKLKLFFSFEEPDQLDVSWRNELSAELLDFVTFSFGLELLYDKNISDRLQAKQVMAIGIVLNML